MKVATYHNLPPGGGKRAFNEITKRLSKKHKLDNYHLKPFFPKNFFSCQAYIYKDLLKLHSKMAKKIDRQKYDVVLLSHDYLTKSPLILRFLKTPSVYLCNEPFREFYEPSEIFARLLKHKIINFVRGPLKKMDEETIKSATIIIANSEYSQNKLSEIYNRKIEKIRPGVDNKKFRMWNIKRQNFFLSVGSLAIFKGIDFLIKAISFLPAHQKFPLVVVANESRDKKYIKDLADRLSVDLKVESDVTDQSLVSLYNRAKLFLYAPYYEPFGLVVLEAMACGLPVVGINEGGLKETIREDKNGWLSERDPKEFSFKIRSALRKVDLGFRNQTKCSVEIWDWSRTVTELEKILNKAKKRFIER